MSALGPSKQAPHDQTAKGWGTAPSCRSAHRHVRPRSFGRQLDPSGVAQSVPVVLRMSGERLNRLDGNRSRVGRAGHRLGRDAGVATHGHGLICDYGTRHDTSLSLSLAFVPTSRCRGPIIKSRVISSLPTCASGGAAHVSGGGGRASSVRLIYQSGPQGRRTLPAGVCAARLDLFRADVRCAASFAGNRSNPSVPAAGHERRLSRPPG